MEISSEVFSLPMMIILWNISGVGSRLKRSFLLKLIRKRKPDIVFIQESKLENVTRGEINRLSGTLNMEFSFVPAEGSSGGIITMWNKESFQPQSINTQGKLNSVDCTLVNVCAPNDLVSRRELWDEITQIRYFSHMPWCLGGDQVYPF